MKSDYASSCQQPAIPQFIARRKELGMTQFELEPKMRLAISLVAKWEVGIRKPSGFLMHCWATALGCNLELVSTSKESIKIQRRLFS